jgi:DNA-binding CsgD family transcriptional regulator
LEVLTQVERTTHGLWQLVGRQDDLVRAIDALEDPGLRGVVVGGPAGVGKTRLALEAATALRQRSRTIIRARATPVSATMPLGALVHLLPAGVLETDDPVARYRQIVAGLPSPAGAVVFLVDDLQWLDGASAGLLGQLLDGGEVTLIGTVRSDVPAVAAVSSLWRRDDVARVELGALGRDDVDTLLHLALGGPVHSAAVAAIWSASSGNPLFVRELVLGAQAAGTLTQRRGVWWLAGRLSGTPQLSEVIHDRVRVLSDAARAALEVVAVWEPLGVAELESVAGAAAVEELDQAGLLDVGLDGRRQPVRLSHPLYGEVIRDGVSRLTRRRLLLDGAARLERFGARRRGDDLRIAVARVEASGAADPALLMAAARVARQAHDYPLVARLTAPQGREVVAPEPALLRAEALHELGQFAEVERLLSETAPTGDQHLDVKLVALRVRNLMWGLQRPEQALAINREARQRISDRALLDELVTDEALTLHHSNRPDDALAALSAMSADPTPRATVLRSIVEIPALTAIGRCDTALGMVDAAYRAHRRLDDASVIAHPGIHLVYRLQALLDAGRLGEAVELAERGYEQASRGGPPLGRTWFAIGLGRAALLAGKPRTARRWLSEGVVLSMGSGFDGPHRLQLSLLATAQAWLGDLDGANESLSELAATPWAAFREFEHDLGRAWTAAVSGDPIGARVTAADCAQRAAAAGQRATEAALLHHLVRLGDPEQAAPRLDVLAASCEGQLVSLYAEHAGALLRRDALVLDAVSTRFAGLGMMLVAAEVANAAADAHRRAGDQRAANAAHVTSRTLAAHCEGASTPALVATSTLVPLTAREREIGTLAAAGLASREIAQRLFLSRRTVENHLQNIYAKLGVRGRNGLAAGLHGTAVSEQAPP